MAEAGQKKSGSGMDGVTIAVIVVVAGFAIFGKKIEARITEWFGGSVGQAVERSIPWIVAVLIVVAVLGIIRMVVGGARKKKRTVLEGASADLFPKSFDPGKGLRIQWKFLSSTIAQVTVKYPPESPDRDPKWRAEVESTMAYRAQFPNWSTSWKPETLTVVMKWAKPAPPVVVTPEDRNRGYTWARVSAILTPLFGTEAIGLSIPSWTQDEGDPPGGFPLRIDVTYQPTTRDISENWRRRLETIVSLKVPPGNARWEAQYFPAQDMLILQHRPPLPTRLMHPGPSLWRGYNGVVIPYALDASGHVAVWAITGPVAKGTPTIHTLIIGATGTGKTSVMRDLLTGATGQGMWVVGADPKRIELTPFRGWPGVLAVASSEEDLGILIKTVYDFMMARYELIEDHNSGDCTCGSGVPCPGSDPDKTMEPLFFFLDELLILRSRLNRWWNLHKGDETMKVWGTKTGTEHPALGMISDLLALARSANIRLVEGVQRPDATLFPDGSRDNLRHRIGLGPLSQQGSEMLWGNPYTGIDIPLTAGRAMASPDGMTPVEVQTYWVPDPRTQSIDEAALIDSLKVAAETALEGKPLPAGLDLSALSERARSIPEGPIIDQMTVTGTLTEHSDDLTTQSVFADQLTPDAGDDAGKLGVTGHGDRVLIDGQVWTVSSVDEIEGQDDYVAVSLTGPGGQQRTEEVPSDSTFDRVVEAATEGANV